MDRVRKLTRIDTKQNRTELGEDHDGDVLDELNNILRFAAAPQSPSAGTRSARPPQSGRDTTLALNLIQRASEAMDQADERASEIEARAIALAERAAGKLKDAEARIFGAEQRARDAEARAEAAEQQSREADLRAEAAEERAREATLRAEAAEQQARDADAWLARLNASIRDTFASRLTQVAPAEIRRTA